MNATVAGIVTNVRAERLLKIPAALGPSCVSPAPQLKREQSLWPEFGGIQQIYATFQRDNLRRHF